MNGGEKFEIEVDGKSILAYSGQTIAEALLASGLRVLRVTRKHAPRGVYCGMGICFDCLVTVNGQPNIRACTTPARPGDRVEVQGEG